jgi:ankyrin repeat protein
VCYLNGTTYLVINLFDTFSSESSPSAASYIGHEAIEKLLTEKGADVNAQGGEHRNPLQAALCKGHEAVAKLLIEKGADVNTQRGEYGNALLAALHKWNEAIARLLIMKGADVNAQG